MATDLDLVSDPTADLATLTGVFDRIPPRGLVRAPADEIRHVLGKLVRHQNADGMLLGRIASQYPDVVTEGWNTVASDLIRRRSDYESELSFANISVLIGELDPYPGPVFGIKSSRDEGPLDVYARRLRLCASGNATPSELYLWSLDMESDGASSAHDALSVSLAVRIATNPSTPASAIAILLAEFEGVEQYSFTLRRRAPLALRATVESLPQFEALEIEMLGDMGWMPREWRRTASPLTFGK